MSFGAFVKSIGQGFKLAGGIGKNATTVAADGWKAAKGTGIGKRIVDFGRSAGTTAWDAYKALPPDQKKFVNRAGITTAVGTTLLATANGNAEARRG